MPQSQISLDRTFQALADPTRRAVIERLSRGPASVGELARPFGMALPSFMQHLEHLESRGLITTRKQGRIRTCELSSRPLEEMAEWLAQQRSIWTARLDRLDAYLDTLNDEDTP